MKKDFTYHYHHYFHFTIIISMMMKRKKKNWKKNLNFLLSITIITTTTTTKTTITEKKNIEQLVFDRIQFHVSIFIQQKKKKFNPLSSVSSSSSLLFMFRYMDTRYNKLLLHTKCINIYNMMTTCWPILLLSSL